MSKPIFRVFVSSTYIDLIDYRKAAEKAINDQKQKYVGMDHMGAMTEEPTDACLEMVEECDLFIGIYAWRYGYVPEGDDYSITEQEYRHAIKLGKPCLCYFVEEDFPWLRKFIETGPAEEKLVAFKSVIEKQHVRSTFKEPMHLERNIINDLSNWLATHRPELQKETLSAGEDPRTAYLSSLAEQYATLSMIGFKRSFDMSSIYIPLTVHADPEAKIHCKPGKPGDTPDLEKMLNRTLKAEDLLDLQEKVAVVLGEPGMGKTTMMHYLALKESQKVDGLFPIYIKLADYCKTNDPLQKYLLTSVDKRISGSAMQQVAQQAISNGKAFILLDGLDEVSRDAYTKVTDCIRAFIASHKNCRVIITSRKAGFQNSEVPFTLFEIDKLPDAEITVFVEKWFAPEPTDLAQRITTNERMRELAQNPFLLSIMCFIFEKDHDLPKRRVELYEKCTATLLTLYDEKQIPKVNTFSRNLKDAALNDLAWYFFNKDVDEFPYSPLTQQLAATLAKREWKVNEDHVLREICENSGLLQKSDDHYFFVHRTFFEYYVACKMREFSQNEALGRAEQTKWEEPLRLYAAQIENVQEGTQFFKNLWQKDTALALRCFADMDRVVEPELIKSLLGKAKVDERIELVKSLPEKISDDVKIVETLGELFNYETNGEVLYWGVQLLEERATIPGAKAIVHKNSTPVQNSATTIGWSKTWCRFLPEHLLWVAQKMKKTVVVMKHNTKSH